jgi:nucleotide-binding universal stress UspA family protein
VTSQTPPSPLPIDHVVHPTDFSPASEIALAHALAIALRARAALTLLHVDRSNSETSWSEFPSVRRMLERWGLLPPGSPRSAVPKLGIEVEKVVAAGSDPVQAIVTFLHDTPAHLLVLATHGRDGVERWVSRPVAEPLARASRLPVLFVPDGVPGFVSAHDGGVTLRRVLLPADRDPAPRAAIAMAGRLAHAFDPGTRFSLLYVGDADAAPAPRLEPAAAWERIVRSGPVVDEIVAAAEALPADLIAMTTRGHHDFLDALRGSTTERVLRRAPCPVLAVPVE